MNKALLGKLLWRFATQKEALWRKVVEWKYGVVEGNWKTREVRSTYGVSVWKFISKRWEDLVKEVFFRVGMVIRLGSGKMCGVGFALLRRISRFFSIWL